jgi:hypothetical protein
MSMLRLLSDGIGDLGLEIRVGVNDVPAFRHGASQTHKVENQHSLGRPK